MAKRDYYEILGVSKNASAEEIKKAHRKKVREYHPDINQDDKEAAAKTQEINEAWEVLSNPKKKANYDRYGSADGPTMGGFGGGGNPFAGGNPFGGGARRSSMFGSMFDDLFGMGGVELDPNAPRRGEDVEVSISFDFMESMQQNTREITVPYLATCSVCHGTGAKAGTTPKKCDRCGGTGEVTEVYETDMGRIAIPGTCPVCSGSGEINESPCERCEGTKRERKLEKVSVTFPAGVVDGRSYKKAGYGDEGLNGGPRGNLLIHVNVKPHPVFVRSGNNIKSTHTITFVQATLGDTIEIPTIDGDVKHKIRPGTQSGTVESLPRKGVPYMRGSIEMRGEHYVTFRVDVPKDLTKEQKEALLQFDKAMASSGHYEKKKNFFDKFTNSTPDILKDEKSQTEE